MEYVIHLIATLLDPSRKAKNMDTEKAEEKLQGQEAEGTERRGGCFYISGGPGTGKTTTIMKAIRMVEESREELPEFRAISVCGQSLTCPEEAYVKMWQGLSDQVGYVFLICLQ